MITTKEQMRAQTKSSSSHHPSTYQSSTRPTSVGRYGTRAALDQNSTLSKKGAIISPLSQSTYDVPRSRISESYRHQCEEEQLQKERMISSAKELQREAVRLQEMFHDSLSIIFELDRLQNYYRDPKYESFKSGCISRYQLTEKMISNHLDDQEEHTPHGAKLRQIFLERAKEAWLKSKPYLTAKICHEIVAHFFKAVEMGDKIWKDKCVVSPGRAKPLNEAQANYMMSLMNQGLIETDRKALHYEHTGRATPLKLEMLIKQAQNKVDEEMHRAKYELKTKSEQFESHFYKHPRSGGIRDWR